MTGTKRTGDRADLSTGRGQSNLLALVVALVVLTLALTASIALVDAAFATGDRDATEQAVATGASERLVAPDGPLADRQNVVNETAMEAFDDRALAEFLPVAPDRAIAVSVDGRELAAVGQPNRGTTVRRIVLVESTERVERTPELTTDRTTVPVRSDRLGLTISPDNATVETVRANDRVLLHDEDGLDGQYDVRLSRYETATLQFEANGTLRTGDVRLRYEVTTDRKAVLAVTVDERDGAWVDDDLVSNATAQRVGRPNRGAESGPGGEHP